jgi:hypothetical protein
LKTCPFCAEEILDAAIRCKHCRSDLVPAAAPLPERPPRALRILLAGVTALALLAVGAPVLARPILSRLHASGGCEPSSWTEWHAAMQQQCLNPSYVCQNMTTSRLLADPDVARTLHEAPTDHVGHLADLVGKMRQQYGCSPEAGAAFRPTPSPWPHAAPVAPPAFPPQEPQTQTL